MSFRELLSELPLTSGYGKLPVAHGKLPVAHSKLPVAHGKLPGKKIRLL